MREGFRFRPGVPTNRMLKRACEQMAATRRSGVVVLGK
jgi:hypothetical protein